MGSSLEAKILVIGDRKIQKILERMYSIAMVKVLRGQQPTIPIKEMKYLVSRFEIRKSSWFPIVKYLEKKGLARYSFGSRFVLVKLSSASLERMYMMKSSDRSGKAGPPDCKKARHNSSRSGPKP